MASEKITMYRTNEDQTVVIEQLPKTVTSQVYDSENEQFLDTTIADINTEITEHKAQKGKPNGYASLDANGKVPSSQISISGGGVVEDASTTQKGIVKLNTSTSSTSTTEAATPSSVKAAYDLANSKYTKPQTGIPSSDLTSDVQATLNKVVDGTTSTKGLVQLTDSITSTSTTTAATPYSVNIVADALTTHNNDYMKHGISATATSVNSYVVTLSPALSTYTKLLRLTLFFDQANTSTTTTVNINGLGAKALKKNDGSGFSVGELKINTPYSFVYNGTDFLADSLGGGGISEEVIINYVDYYTEISNVFKTADTLSLTVAREYAASTSIGDYTLIGGGSNSSGESSVVDAYNSSLVRTTPTALSISSRLSAATTVGNYALFGGGGYLETPRSNVNAYNSSLVRTTPTALSVPRTGTTATTVGNYALFGGGGDSANAFSTVDAYNSSLVRTTATSLSVARAYFSATTAGDYALFGGGAYYSGGGIAFSNTVDIYNSSLTRYLGTDLDIARYNLNATHIGKCALFAGGADSTNVYSTVDVYDADVLVKQTSVSLVSSRQEIASTSLDNYAVFAGGEYGGTSSGNVETFDKGLIRVLSNTLTTPRHNLTASRIGNFVLLSGGVASNIGVLNSVDVYTNTYSTIINIIAGSIYKFNNSDTEQTAATDITLSFTDKVTGYVKVKSVTLTK